MVAQDLPLDRMLSEQFDHVIVATGHFAVPNVPQFNGIEQFPGRVMHAHDFRSAQEFAGKNLLVVGASYSAEDIGLQCKKYGARSITFSYRTAAMGFRWPDGMEERPLLQRLEGRTAHFKDEHAAATSMSSRAPPTFTVSASFLSAPRDEICAM